MTFFNKFDDVFKESNNLCVEDMYSEFRNVDMTNE